MGMMTIDELATNIDGLKVRVDTLTTTVNGLGTTVGSLATTVGNLATTVDKVAISIQKDLLGLDAKISALSDKVDDMRIATKKDIADLREEMNVKFATHSELQSVEDRILEEIGKIKYAKEIDELRGRVNIIEREIGIKPQVPSLST